MTAIPESKLVWSTECPKFEDVKGKTVLVRWKDQYGEFGLEARLMDTESYWHATFGMCFSRYAILDLTAPVSPLPLWGAEPRFIKTILQDYFWAWADEVTSFSKRGFEDEQAAVIDWNYFVEKVWGGNYDRR